MVCCGTIGRTRDPPDHFGGTGEAIAAGRSAMCSSIIKWGRRPLITRALAGIACFVVFAGCGTTAPSATPTGNATVHGTLPAKAMHVILTATVTGEGNASVTYAGDPSEPAGGTTTFQHSWQREFDIGHQDWEAIDKISVKVTEVSGNDATVTCAVGYDDHGGIPGHRRGPHKATTCYLSYGDVE